MKDLLEKIIEETRYDDLGEWCLPDIVEFSANKRLFEYQENALKNITKVLHLYFESEEKSKRQELFNLYKLNGLKDDAFNISKYAKKNDKNKGLTNKKFSFFQNHFKTIYSNNDEYISGHNFINRACFWMATGSGKSIVLIKTIELLDYLQKQGLIPKKEIMLLLPREDLIKQFKKEIKEFNQGRDRKIELISLKNYEDDKQRMDFNNTIKVYYYRSDLIRAERKESILDYRSYENKGNWYVFLDEAHRGDKEISLMQDYVSVLSKNGFLFNFSATFTEDIDYITTCYNFNLEKFILAGYGKNLYLSSSYFNFKKNKDEFNEREKQKQVLKSLIVFTLIKKTKKEKIYHNPLLVTLVNSVNTNDPDLLLLFKKLEEIAGGEIDSNLFNETKEEILNELENQKGFVFGNEELAFNSDILKNLKLQDLLKAIFNTDSAGKIELLEGEKGKEIALKLETSEKPFALIKIGDAKKFQREKLGNNYNYISSFEEKRIFEGINHNEDINLLLGSRSFYEGWDSNRPNVINMINIGGKEAKKFVLQAIGRGIRIEPHKNERKRLSEHHKDKNKLLETLFVFATDKNSVKAIIETVEEQKVKDEIEISLFENKTKPFDLLIPKYDKDENKNSEPAKFNIAENSLRNFKNYIASFDKDTLLIKTGLSKKDLDFLLFKVENNQLFSIRNDNIYSYMELLLQKIVSHIFVKNKVVSGIKELEEEIVHFKHIKVINFTDEEVKSFKEQIQQVYEYEAIDKKEIESSLKEGKISFDEALKLGNAKNEADFKNLKIKKIAQHYYLPLIYSENEKVEYIKHIIKVDSEVSFIKNLDEYIKNNQIQNDWMFSKVDESLDKIGMPYFYTRDNKYRDFHPDFIFWIKKGNDYKIVFVDPKGTIHTDYLSKIDGFEKLFLENSKTKNFKYKNFNITFDLKFITNDMNYVLGEKYKKYWLGNNDFSFLLE